MKEPLRRISLDGATFNWRVTHRHKPEPTSPGEQTCLTQLLVFRQGTSNVPSLPVPQERRSGAQTILALLALCTILQFAPAAAQTTAPLDSAFAASKVIEVPTEIVAGVPVTVGFRVRNDGPETTYTRASFDIPTGMLLAARPQDCFAHYDAEQRQFVFEGPMIAGWESTCHVSLVALPDAANHAQFSLRLFTPPDRYAGDVVATDINDPPTPAAVTLGGYGATRAGIIFLAWAILWLALSGLARSRTSPGRGDKFFSPRVQAVSAANAIAIGIGFLIIFAVLAWDDWRTLSAYREARCEIFDLAFKQETVAAAADGSHSSLQTGSASKPVLSLGYTFDGKVRQTLGFSTDSRLSFTPAELDGIVRGYRNGQSVSCWIDPDDPRRVVVLKGFGGAYIFAPLPTLLLVFGLWLWPRATKQSR